MESPELSPKSCSPSVLDSRWGGGVIRYLDVCSGYSAFSLANEGLDFQCAGYSEIEPFPRAILEQRHGAVPVDWDHRHTPGSNVTPLFGDFTKIEAHHVGPVDLLIGGTPCQAFSVAGKRLGLDDPRGNLTLEFLALARRLRVQWLAWENVPGFLSHDEGRTMGTFVGLLGQLGFGWAYRVLDAQFIRVDGCERAVPQRRRRLFVVGHLGDAAGPAAVLFERESLRGDPAPRRQAGEGIAPTISARTKGGGGLGTDFDCDGGLIAADVAGTLRAGGNRTGGNRPPGMGQETADTRLVAATVSSKWAKGSGGPSGDECQNLLAVPAAAHAYRIPPNDTPYATGDVTASLTTGTDNAAITLLEPVMQPFVLMERGRADGPNLETRQDGTANAILTPNGGRGGMGVGAIAYSIIPQNSGKDYKAREVDVAQPLMAGGPVGGNQGGDFVAQPVAFCQNTRDEVRLFGGDGQTVGALGAEPGMKQQSYVAQPDQGWAVRRLTPTECERLMGVPDGFTAITFRKKPAADGPRYKALGNSQARNVMRWLAHGLRDVMRAQAEAGSGRKAA